MAKRRRVQVRRLSAAGSMGHVTPLYLSGRRDRDRYATDDDSPYASRAVKVTV